MPSVIDVVYQVLLIADLEIYPFAISGKIEYVLVLCLGVLEVPGFLLADTSAIGSDEVAVYIIGNWKESCISYVNDLLTYQKCTVRVLSSIEFFMGIVPRTNRVTPITISIGANIDVHMIVFSFWFISILVT